jgi:hypothetical protein
VPAASAACSSLSFSSHLARSSSTRASNSPMRSSRLEVLDSLSAALHAVWGVQQKVTARRSVGNSLGCKVCHCVIKRCEGLLPTLGCLRVPHFVGCEQMAELFGGLQSAVISSADQLGSCRYPMGGCGSTGATIAAQGQRM